LINFGNCHESNQLVSLFKDHFISLDYDPLFNLIGNYDTYRNGEK
jgi:hypothetical protein